MYRLEDKTPSAKMTLVTLTMSSNLGRQFPLLAPLGEGGSLTEGVREIRYGDEVVVKSHEGALDQIEIYIRLDLFDIPNRVIVGNLLGFWFNRSLRRAHRRGRIDQLKIRPKTLAAIEHRIENALTAGIMNGWFATPRPVPVEPRWGNTIPGVIRRATADEVKAGLRRQ